MSPHFFPLLLPVLAVLTLPSRAAADAPTQADVIVYEGTPAGVMTAVAAARLGSSVILVEMNNHVGGVVAGGLCDTDIGARETVGGLSKEFFDRISKYYHDTYGPQSEQVADSRNGLRFEPHVAEMVYDQMLAEQHVTVWKRNRLKSITQNPDGTITSLVVDDLAHGGTRTFTGRMFVDASYEGDLMAMAHVPWREGREARSEYGEYVAGISVGPQEGQADNRLQAYNYRASICDRVDNRVLFPKPEHYDPSPFRSTDGQRIIRRNDPGFSWLYSDPNGKSGPNGKYDSNWGDQAGLNAGYVDGDWTAREQIAARIRDHYLSRLYYLQNDPELPAPFHADAQHWGLSKDEFTDNGNFPFQLYVREARRMVGGYVLKEQDITQDRFKPDGIATGSYGVDCHECQILQINGKPVVDHIKHVEVEPYDIPYGCLTPPEKAGQPGNLLVPVCVSASHVAYCSLRMEPVYMMLGQAAGAAVHLALVNKVPVQKVDVPQLRDVLRQQGAILDCGYQPQVKITWAPPHPRPGQSVQFQAQQGTLKNPITHFWWDFEGDGKVGGTGETASYTFSLEKPYNVSLVVEDSAGLRRMVTVEVPVGSANKGKDVTIDDFDADLAGRWDAYVPQLVLHKHDPDVFWGPGSHRDYTHDGKTDLAVARFRTRLPAGRYEVCLAFRPAANQATKVPIVIHAADGSTTSTTVDERTVTDSPFPFVSLGEYRFSPDRDALVQVTNKGADGRVALDGLRWVWLGP